MLPDYRVRQRDSLLEISRALTSRLDLSEVLRLILQLSAEIMDGQAALLALVDSDGRYRIRDAIGISQPMIEQLRPVLAEISDAREAETALLSNLVTLAQQAGIGRWTIIWLPLKNGDDSLGALYVFRGRGGEFSANDRRVLQSFADQAAIAVNNAQLYQQINTERKRLAAILEFSADGVVIMDNARKIRTFNRVLIQLLGIAADDAIGKRFEDVLKVTNIRAGKTLEQAEAQGWPLATSTPVFVEGDLLRPDGRLVPVDISFAPLFDNTGQLVNIIADVHDLTRYRAADEMKSNFVSLVSHEFRTPLGVIMSAADVLNRYFDRLSEDKRARRNRYSSASSGVGTHCRM